MKLQIINSAPKIIGALRVSDKVFDKVTKLAKQNNCSNQEIIRAILEQVIDEVE